MTRKLDPDGFDWRGWLIPGLALISVGLLAAVLIVAQNGPPADTTTFPSPTAGDDHEVATAQGTVSFRLEGGAIVVDLATASGSSELGRGPLAGLATAPPNDSATPTGIALFVMVCGSVDGAQPRRYVFGHLDTVASPEYAGPEAEGRGASDGLFLFAIRPDAPAGPIRITARDGSSVGLPSDSFARAFESGVRQSSGCNVLD